MIAVENLTKSYGAHVLFEEVSFRINRRERVGLVGRNGHGKTTLFRMILGQEHPDFGSITAPNQYRIGYVQQEIVFTEQTIVQEGMKGLMPHEKDHSWKVEKILLGLGFTMQDMSRRPEEFSGGFQVRLNLAKALVAEPDLLLLDEPTNYLDITSIRWLERFLLNWQGELLLITHDRGFMDKLATHTLGIHRRKIRKIPGNTEKFYAQIIKEEETYEKTRMNDERRRKEVELFISRFRSKARLANLVQSRVKMLAKTEKKDKLEKMKMLDFAFRYNPYHGKYLLTAENLTFSYEGQKPLIKDFSFTIAAQDRIGIIGKNGKGKTTLLKLLAGSLEPHKGLTLCNAAVVTGYFEQTNVSRLASNQTVEDEIMCSHPDIDRQTARNICGLMLFEGDDALKKIEVLSGGEKSRVLLGKLLATPLNLLLLDEVTNHFDMESCDALLAAIDNFEGAVAMVTHNEMFLHALAQRLIVFQNDRIETFEGTYQDFLEKRGWDEENEPSVQGNNAQDNGAKINKKDLRRKRSEIITERSKVIKPIELRIAQIEDEIDGNEKQLKELDQGMITASTQQDGKAIVQISRSMHERQQAIERLFGELETLTNELAERQTFFEKKLEQVADDF